MKCPRTRRRRPPDRDVRARRNPRAALDSASRRGVPPKTTNSVYMQDRWVVSPQLALNLGHAVRVRRGSEATTGQKSPGLGRVVPRLGAAYDLAGDGQTVLQASFSQGTRAGTTRRSSRVIPTSAIRIATRWSVRGSRGPGAFVRAGVRSEQLLRGRRGHIPGVERAGSPTICRRP